MSGVVQQLKKERVRLEDQLHIVTAALTAFGRAYMHGTGPKAVAGRKRGTMSAAGRRRIRLAQKARWAKQRTAKPKRTISAAGREPALCEAEGDLAKPEAAMRSRTSVCRTRKSI